jgi:hypothetical protein
LKNCAAFADTHVALVGDVGIPDSIVGIDADAIGLRIFEVGPHPSTRPTSVCGDVKGWDSPSIRTRRQSTGSPSYVNQVLRTLRRLLGKAAE